MRWMEGFAGSDPKRAPFAREAAVALPSTAASSGR
jgi:hypothetical protein